MALVGQFEPQACLGEECRLDAELGTSHNFLSTAAKGKRNAKYEIGKYNTRATCHSAPCTMFHIFSARDYYSRFRDSLLKTSICSTLCAISLCARVSVPRAISEQAQGARLQKGLGVLRQSWSS